MNPPGELSTATAELLQQLWSAVQSLPDAVVQRAQRLWLDTVACACAGLHADEPQRWLTALAAGDAGPVPLPGSSLTLGASPATLALAVGACWDEACEGLALAHGRPGVPVVAALWPQLALRRPSWMALWQSTAVGYEVCARLGARMRIRPGLHVDGLWSAFGAAAATVHLTGGSWQQALAALETCAVQLPFSLYRPVRQGAQVRNLYLGHSAWLGRQAALTALADWSAPGGALDEVMALALDGSPAGHWPPPGPWLMLDSYWKPFAAVRHVHYGAQAALRWRALGIDPATLDAIELQVYPEALQYCPNRDPQSVLAAQFSLSFGVAAALRYGDLSPAEYRPGRFDDALLRRLEALVVLQADAATWPPPQRGACLRLRTGTRAWTIDQGAVIGDAGLQPEAAAVQAKFARYTRHDPDLQRWADRLLQDPLQAIAALPHDDSRT